MDEIDQITQAAQSIAAPNTRGYKDKKPDTFENALSKAIDETEDSKMEHMSANGLTEITSNSIDIVSSSDIISDQTDKLLGMLDLYSSKLVDPDIPLKNIAPVLEEINDTAGNLLKETQSLENIDTDLRKIAKQTIVSAQTEYLKFQRGDYLS